MKNLTDNEYRKTAKILSTRIMNRYPWLWTHQDDIYSNALCAIWEMSKTFNPDKAKWSTWINGFGIKRLVDKLREDGILSRRKTDRPKEITNYESDILTHDKTDNVLDCGTILDKLLPKKRSILIRKYLQGYTQVEIARQDGCTESNISLLHKKALNDLKEKMNV